MPPKPSGDTGLKHSELALGAAAIAVITIAVVAYLIYGGNGARNASHLEGTALMYLPQPLTVGSTTVVGLATMNFAGGTSASHAVVTPPSAAGVSGVAASADGSRVAFVFQKGSAGSAILTVQSLDGTQADVVASSTAGMAIVAPTLDHDGSLVAYGLLTLAPSSGSAATSTQSATVVLNPATRKSETLADATPLGFTPDGSRLFVLAESGIALYDFSAGTSTSLSFSGALPRKGMTQAALSPVFSPDASRLALVFGSTAYLLALDTANNTASLAGTVHLPANVKALAFDAANRLLVATARGFSAYDVSGKPLTSMNLALPPHLSLLGWSDSAVNSGTP